MRRRKKYDGGKCPNSVVRHLSDSRQTAGTWQHCFGCENEETKVGITTNARAREYLIALAVACEIDGDEGRDIGIQE